MVDKIDSKKLRQVAGGFATGITIVTALTNEKEVVGMTASSFVSISLDPPLVGFFVTLDAEFLAHMKIGKAVAISILSAKQKDISNQFAGMTKEDIEISFDTNGDYYKISSALAWYETIVEGIIPAGDHVLLSCRVIDLRRDDSKHPLLYYSGYRGIGSEIE